MDKKVTYDFDTVVSRDGTHCEKYEARKRYFGDAEVEPFWVADMDLITPGFVADAMARKDLPEFGALISEVWRLNNELDPGSTNADVEGDATALYLARLLKPLGVRVTRLASGIPLGGELEFVDSATLSRALSERREF